MGVSSDLACLLPTHRVIHSMYSAQGTARSQPFSLGNMYVGEMAEPLPASLLTDLVFHKYKRKSRITIFLRKINRFSDKDQDEKTKQETRSKKKILKKKRKSDRKGNRILGKRRKI